MGRKKLTELKQVHGKDEEKELETFQPTTLDQILGKTRSSKYQTSDVEEYQNFLNDMNKSDLQAHAIHVGFPPVDDRERLVKKLLTEFRKDLSMYQRPRTVRAELNPSKEALAILAQGR